MQTDGNKVQARRTGRDAPALVKFSDIKTLLKKLRRRLSPLVQRIRMLLKFYKHRCANLYQGRRSLPVLHATPSKARIEASTACQLACVACPTPQGIINTHLGTGLLKSADF